MRYLVAVRHAQAVEPDTEGYRDLSRPLTARGRRLFGMAVRGLRDVLPHEDVAILTSPLVRAWQTAEILGEAWDVAPSRCEHLAPEGDLRGVLAEARAAGCATVFVVGTGRISTR